MWLTQPKSLNKRNTTKCHSLNHPPYEYTQDTTNPVLDAFSKPLWYTQTPSNMTNDGLS